MLKVDFWWSTWVRYTNIRIPPTFWMKNPKMESVFWNFQYLTTCCDVTLPYLGKKRKWWLNSIFVIYLSSVLKDLHSGYILNEKSKNGVSLLTFSIFDHLLWRHITIFGQKEEIMVKFDFWWSTWVRFSKICIPAIFWMKNPKIESVFWYSQYLTTCCDVTLPYLGINRKWSSKFDFWWSTWVRSCT